MTTQLNDKLLAVPVPQDATDFFINNVGCIRYSTDNGRQSSCIEPQEMGVYLEKENYSILGLVTPKEIGFDPKPYIESTSYNTDIDGEVFLYLDYPKHNFDWINPADSFRSLLQSKGLDSGHYLIIEKI